MKRLLWILLPALVLAGLVVVNRTLSGWHYVVTGEPDDLLYAASFDGDSSGFNADWEQYEGRLSASILNSTLRLTIGDAERGAYSLAGAHYADFDLRTQARAVEGPVNNGYGLIYRIQDRNNYYLFMVSSDGYYAVQRILNGQPKFLSAWINTTLNLPELNGVVVNTGLGAVNELRVVAQGDQFTFYVNGVGAPLCIPNDPEGESVYYEIFDTPEERCVQGTMTPILTDSSVSQGSLGVVARSYAFGEVDRAVIVDFDHVLVFGA